MLRAGADVEIAWLNHVAGFGFLHANFGELGKLRGELRGKRSWHVLHENYGSGKFLGEARREAHDRGRSAVDAARTTTGKR